MNNREIEEYFDRLPGRGVNFAFDGLLRCFCANDKNWASVWSLCSGLNFNWTEAIAYDVFGSVYAAGDSGQVYIFSLDSGDKTSLEVDVNDFFDAIIADPASTIRSDVYKEAMLKLGRLNDSENYALRVEGALGGKFHVENMYICERTKHVSILGKIARQIRDVPVGTLIKLGDYNN